MIVRDVLAQGAAQATLVPDDHVLEALATEGADQAFDERILQGAWGAVITSSTPKVLAVRRKTGA